jgi:hypothetical protein
MSDDCERYQRDSNMVSQFTVNAQLTRSSLCATFATHVFAIAFDSFAHRSERHRSFVFVARRT